MSFDPVTMSIVSTAFSAASAIMGGIQAKKQAKYEEGVAQFNARQSENQAIREQNAGIEKARDRAQRARQLTANQQAKLAAQGVDIGSGSSLDILEGTEQAANIDLYRINQNTDQLVNSNLQQSQLSLAEGRAARSRGNNVMVGSLLTAGSKVAGSWSSFGGSKYSTGATGGSGLTTTQRSALFTPYKPVSLY